MQSHKRRTFVFITDIPDFLLKPIHGATLRETRETRDPRYERLRLLLADHTAGLMAVMHLETRGYALALYASEEEAVAACQTTIVPESVERNYPPLTLRIIEKEKPRPPEAVYTPSLLIEGEEVAKDDLAETRGLELVYRGQRIARWCECTREGRDCPYGTACNRIHRKQYQRTVRRRPRAADDESAAPTLTTAEEHAVQAIVLNKQAAHAYATATAGPSTQATAPPLLTLPTVYVPVTLDELEHDLLSAAPPDSTTLSRRLQAALAAHTEEDATPYWPADWATKGPFFLKLSCPGGAPWYWSLYDDCDDRDTNAEAKASGLARLRRMCPFPANGIATPLQRDLLEQKLLYSTNQLNRFTTVEEGLHALRCAYKAGMRDAVNDFRTSWEAQTHRHRARKEEKEEAEADGHEGAANKAPSNAQAPPLFICVQPWLYLPTAGCEVTAFTERSGRRPRGVVQRHGSLRLMASVALLHTPSQTAVTTSSQDDTSTQNALMQLNRFAIPENEVDIEAERLMASELSQFNSLFVRAAAEWNHRLELCSSSAPPQPGLSALPSEAPWCGHFALVLSPPPPLPTAAPPRADGGSHGVVVCKGVVMLSLAPYQRAAEECVLFSFLRPCAAAAPETAADTAASSYDPSRVGWNTQKHPFIPLFSIDQLGRLRARHT